jgi:hypothetical protein
MYGELLDRALDVSCTPCECDSSAAYARLVHLWVKWSLRLEGHCSEGVVPSLVHDMVTELLDQHVQTLYTSDRQTHRYSDGVCQLHPALPRLHQLLWSRGSTICIAKYGSQSAKPDCSAP